MKKKRFLITLTLILFFHLSQAQLIMIDGETGEYKYEEVVSAQGKSKHEIQSLADQWVDLYYQNSFDKSIDSISLRKQGHNKLEWNFINKNIPINVFFDIEIKTKDGRYKYSFSNFKIGKIINGEIDSSDLKIYIERFPKKYQNSIEEPIDEEITKAIASMDFYIKNGKIEDDEDDW